MLNRNFKIRNYNKLYRLFSTNNNQNNNYNHHIKSSNKLVKNIIVNKLNSELINQYLII